MPDTSTSDSLKLHNVQIDDLLTMGDDAPLDLDEHSSSPSTPESGRVRLYAKADGVLYRKNDSGTETALDAATAGAVMKTDYDANSLLAADSDDTPQALTVAASRLVGRQSSGGIAALPAGDALGVLAAALWPIRQPNGWYDGDWRMQRLLKIVGSVNWPLAADQLVLVPFFSPFADWDEIAVDVAVAESGKEMKLALYETGSDGRPGSVVWESASIDLSSTGEKTVSLGDQPSPGWWWIGVNSDSSSAGIVSANTTVRLIPPTTVAGDPGFNYTKSGVTYASTPFPDSPSGLTIQNSIEDLPWVKMRVTS